MIIGKKQNIPVTATVLVDYTTYCPHAQSIDSILSYMTKVGDMLCQNCKYFIEIVEETDNEIKILCLKELEDGRTN